MGNGGSVYCKYPPAKQSLSFHLECFTMHLIKIFSPFQITWLKDGKTLKSGPNMNITYSLGICSLEISACTLEDAGRYTLRAENNKGDTETSCKVTVNGQ